jgi:hypothetical protein
VHNRSRADLSATDSPISGIIKPTWRMSIIRTDSRPSAIRRYIDVTCLRRRSTSEQSPGGKQSKPDEHWAHDFIIDFCEIFDFCVFDQDFHVPSFCATLFNGAARTRQN